MHPLITLLCHLVYAVISTVQPPREFVRQLLDEFIRNIAQASHLYASDLPYDPIGCALKPFYADRRDPYPLMLRSTPPLFFSNLYADLVHAATPKPNADNLDYRIALTAACTTFNGISAPPFLFTNQLEKTAGAAIMVMLNARHLPHDQFIDLCTRMIAYINTPNGNLLHRAIFYYIYTITYNLPHLPIPPRNTTDKGDTFTNTLVTLHRILIAPRTLYKDSHFRLPSVDTCIDLLSSLTPMPTTPSPRAAIAYSVYFDLCLAIHLHLGCHPDIILNESSLQTHVTQAMAMFGVQCCHHMWWLFHECNMPPLMTTTGDLVWPRTFTEHVPYTTYPGSAHTRPQGNQ